MAPYNNERPHRSEIRVRYAETDQAKVAYHANYLHWFEVGRTEMLREMGLPYGEFERSRRIFLTVTETQLAFHRPARYDELIRVETWPAEVRRVRFRLEHRLVRVADGVVVCTGWLWLAAVDEAGAVVSLPADLLTLLRS